MRPPTTDENRPLPDWFERERDLRESGDSVVVTIPQVLVEATELEVDEYVDLVTDGERLHIQADSDSDSD